MKETYLKGVHQDVLGHSVYGADHGVLYSTRTGCCPPSVSGSGRGLPFNPGSDDWICCRNIPPAYATAAMECLRAEVESFKVLLQSVAALLPKDYPLRASCFSADGPANQGNHHH